MLIIMNYILNILKTLMEFTAGYSEITRASKAASESVGKDMY